MSPRAAPVAVEVVTAAEAEDAARRAAGWMAAHGLVAGDRIAFCLPSSVALLTAVLGALRTGIVPVLLNASLLDAERDALVADAEPSAVVTDAAALAEVATGEPVELAPVPLARPMHYTSGTTGRAKGVWSGLWDERTAAEALADEAELWHFGPDDVHLVCSPMYHSVSVRFAGGTLLAGGTCVVLGRFDADTAVAALAGHAGPTPTTTFLAPSALSRLLAPEVAAPDRFDALRLLVHAGSPCPPDLKRRAMARVGPGAVWEFYGSTEGQFTACSPEEWLERPGTVGRARPGRVLAVDEGGTIWCRPPAYARFSYWRDQAKTAAAWRDDGSFTVGDLGRLDDAGYLYLDGRRDDLVISGGVNVYPAEVEGALHAVPGVAEVAVFGREDPRWGQRVCAAVVPAAGAGQGAGGLVSALEAHAASALAPYKRPKEYHLCAELPRTSTGKLRRLDVAGCLGLEPARPGAGPEGQSGP